jgi:hypothetical protein
VAYTAFLSFSLWPCSQNIWFLSNTEVTISTYLSSFKKHTIMLLNYTDVSMSANLFRNLSVWVLFLFFNLKCFLTFRPLMSTIVDVPHR